MPPSDETRTQPPTDTDATVAAPHAPAEAGRAAGPVPGFQIVRELGRGGMGVVYEAAQAGLGRTVALKMLIAGSYSDPTARARFLLEAEAVAALQHPHIVQVFAFGEADGCPYLAMEFLPGGSLADRVKGGGPLTPVAAAEVVVKLADAAAHAHSRGVVHRDIKPHNVLLAADGEPRLADFGLAKVERSDLSVTGQVLGTPAYMAPEQAAGQTKLVGTGADVYALGAVLYDLLTGHPPFRGESAAGTLLKVLNEEPARPRAVRPDIPRDLETICLHCLEKNPARRYPTAAALAADLRSFLGGCPIAARPVGPGERLWKWVRRRPGRAAALAACALVLAGAGVAAEQVRRNREADRRAAEADARDRQRAARADALVDALTAADTASVGPLLEALSEFRDLTGPRLRSLAEQPASTKPGLHARLALLAGEPGRAPELVAYLPGCRPEELLPVRRLLTADAAPPLWSVLADPGADPGRRARAAGALAALAPDDPRWEAVADPVARAAARAAPDEFVALAAALEPVRARLLPPLLAQYAEARDRIRSGQLGESELVAEASAFDLTAALLARYAADRPAELAELALAVDGRHYPRFAAAIRAHRSALVPALTAELSRQATPGAPDTDLDALSRRRGHAAAALLALGATDRAWPAFQYPADGDPGARSYLLARVAAVGADPLTIVDRFEAEPDAGARRALLLALGEFPLDRLPPDRRAAVTTALLDRYRRDPDPGLHAAADWVLRRWGKEPERAAVDARLEADARARAALRAAAFAPPLAPLARLPDAAPGRDWFVNGEGQTFAVLRGPRAVEIGSPEDEPGRFEVEARHTARIGRTFAIATREVTVDQFLRFAPKHDWPARYSPGPDTPAVGVSWYAAAGYCNWLSAREGLPESQWCYEPNGEGRYEEGMRVKPGHLALTGYRLPTEAEWECACRAGSAVARPFGRGDELLPRYAWYLKNSDERARPCGGLRPNDLGLFDVLGNAFEWVGDPFAEYDPARAEDDGGPNPGPVAERSLRVTRGGSFLFRAPNLRAADRNDFPPGYRYFSVGFRPARTVPD